MKKIRLSRSFFSVVLSSILVLFASSASSYIDGVPDPSIQPDESGPAVFVPVPAAGSAVVHFEELAARNAAMLSPASPFFGTAAPFNDAPPEPLIQTFITDITEPQVPQIVPPLAPSPAAERSFGGLDDDQTFVPPDTDGAVGLAKVMSGLNNGYRIQDKLTGVTRNTLTTSTFWSATGGSGFFDPKTLYDPFNHRWIVVALSNAASPSSSIVFGLSRTSDPEGLYDLFRVDADSTDTYWADFPNVGFNKNWLAINVNMFTISTPYTWNAAKILILDYPQLLAGIYSGGFVTSGPSFCTAPAATYSGSEETLYAPTHTSSFGGTYRVDTITGTPGSPVYTKGINKSRETIWFDQSGDILPQNAPLSGASACGATPCPINTQDPYIRSTPVFRDGFIYYSQTVGLPAAGPVTHTAIQWTKVDASTGNFADGGRIEDPTATATSGKWYAYPHIAVNRMGDILVGFSQFGAGQYAGAGYAYHSRTDGAGVMGDPLIYKAGDDYYNKRNTGTRNRWGDYSKAQVDPSNDMDLWVLNEYAKARVGTSDATSGSTDSRWGTWWAMVDGGAARVSSAPGVFYSSISSAYGFTPGGDTIQALATDFVENISLALGTAFTLRGGYSGIWVPNSGITAIEGSLTIISGTVTLDNIALK